MTRLDQLTLEALGRTPQAAIRTMLDTFRHRGWRDSGAALAIVNALEESEGTLTFRAAAKRIPTEFLVRNEVKRDEVEKVLRELAAKP